MTGIEASANWSLITRGIGARCRGVAPENAIRAAYSSGDKEWILTAVFSMRWIGGFDDPIFEALKSSDAEIQSRAIQAAGN